MKRRRGKAQSKAKVAQVCNVDDVIQSVVRANAHEWGFDDNHEARQSNNGTNQQTIGKNLEGVDPTGNDNMGLFVDSNAVDCTSFSKIARSNPVDSSRGVLPLSSGSDQVRGKRTQQKEQELSHQDLQYNDQELQAALSVIRIIMNMDAAAPFNLPVDPVALGIHDYFDIVEKPMDFSTICDNLEDGHTYQNSEDVFRDVQYIWENCIKSNKKGHYILDLMKSVKRKFMILWTEAGLFTDQQLEINGFPHVSASRSALMGSIYGQKGSSDKLACGNSQQDKVKVRGHPLYPPQRRPDHSSRSPREPMACRHVVSSAYTGAARICDPCENGYQVDATDDFSIHTRSQMHHHQSSMSYSKSVKPRQKPSNCRPTRDHSQHSHQLAGTFFATEEHPHIPPLRDFSARQVEVSRSQRDLHQPSVNCSQTQERSSRHIPSSGRQLFSHSVAEYNIDSTDKCVYQQQHQTSSSYGHTHQPSSKTCRGMLSSRKQPTSSAKPHADIEMENAEDEFQSPPLPKSMINYTKCATSKYPSANLQSALNCGEMDRHWVDESSSQLHATSSEPHTNVDMDSSDEFLSPLPAESMISCAKRGPNTDPAGCMPDIISHPQRDDIASSQIQPQKSPSEGPPSSSQPHSSHPQAPLDDCFVVGSKIKKKTMKRGPTRCLNVWNSEDKLPVSTDEFGQPIGPDAPKFIFFLGTVARNGKIAPLNYINWKAVPDENKENMWQLVESKFLVDPRSKDSILKSIGTKWKNWKALLKAKHYSPHETDEERLADCNERVQPDQWRILVSFWNSAEAKEQSNINKANRSKFTSNHACGSKSFARVREEQRIKRLHGEEPSQADLFIATHTRKNGQPVNEASSVIIAQLRDAAQQQGTSEKDTIPDDVFVQVMGEETPGRVRTPGVGPTLSKLSTSKPLPVDSTKIGSEANAEVREMKEKMVAMEQTCAQMAAQIAKMMAMMQKKDSNNERRDENGSNNSERSEESLPASHDVPSLQRPRTRSGKK